MGIFSSISNLFKPSCSRCDRLEAKLFVEIDSNRLREQEFLQIILNSQNLPSPGRRTALHTTNIESEEVEGLLPTELTPSQQKQVESVVRQFIDAAAERGTPHSEEEIEILRKQVYENSDLYGI